MSSIDLQAALAEHFAFEHFKPGQEEVIGHLLHGHSAAAVFPTGGGKSLCYQLTALELPGLTLVVSPLIALMKDQIDALQARGIAAARLDSSLDADGYRRVMAQLRSGELKLLYTAPERFNNERFRATMAQQRLSLLAVDEAHCISEWGHNFRPDYLKLAGYAERFGVERVLALTATAPPQVLDDIRRGFDIAPEHAVRTGFYRPNLALLTTPVTAEDRDAALVERLGGRESGAAIVYVTLQKTAVAVAERLRAAGFQAAPYHAGLESEERERIQENFLASDDAIVVATIAFGMGIDKSNIRSVYHYNLPKSLENYAQEIGRAGRDGEISICEVLANPADLDVLRNFAHGDTPDRGAVQALVDAIFGGGDDALSLNLNGLSAGCDLRILVVRTLLTYLELGGWIEAGTPTYSVYRFQPSAPSAEILGRFEGERRDFLRDLFRQAKKARTWFDIDLEAASERLNQPRARLVSALDFLAEQQLLTLKPSGVRHAYRVLRRPEDPGALASELYDRALALESRELERLDQVLELTSLDDCRWRYLSRHFGEELDGECGHCSWCLDGGAEPLPEVIPAEIDDALWARAGALRNREAALAPPRAFTRFLVGLTSPKLTRAKLSRHELFGCLGAVPFLQVLERVDAEAPGA
ncbi:MAG: ATP-dependent DNA helicase RecQ [Acidobacteriota bacterium]